MYCYRINFLDKFREVRCNISIPVGKHWSPGRSEDVLSNVFAESPINILFDHPADVPI